MRQRSKRTGLPLIAVGLAVLLAVPSATGRGVAITGKLHSQDRDIVDQNSSISMTVVVRDGKPRKLKNVVITYSYDCGDGRTGIAKARFAKAIDIRWKPGITQDRVDFKRREIIPDSDDAGTTRDGERYIQGDVTRRGRRASGQIFLTFDDYVCANDQSYYSAPLAQPPPRKAPR